MPGGRVLVVGGGGSGRSMIGAALKRAGYEVVEADNARTGIETIQAGQEPLSVDLILCDVPMPPVDGVDSIHYCRSQCPAAPIVVMADRADLQQAAGLFKQGVVDYVIKPVSPDTLLDVVRRAAAQQVLFDKDANA